MSTKNLGLVKALHVGTTPPTNTVLLWFDVNTGVNLIKYYNTSTLTWLPFVCTSLTSDQIVNLSSVVGANVTLALNQLLSLANAGVKYADTTTAAMQFVINESSFASNLSTKVPTQQSVKTYVDGKVAGGIHWIGGYNATTNTPNLTTPSVGAVLKGYMYTVATVGSAFFGETMEIGDVLISNIDNPTLLTDWTRVEKNIDQVDDSMYYWVDGNAAGDDANPGTKAKPWKTIDHAVLTMPANATAICRKANYQEGLLAWSDNASIADNITIYGEIGATLRGPDRNNAAYTSFSTGGSKAFLFTVNTAKTFNIKGFFDFTGDFGLFSCDHASAIINCELNTHKLNCITGGMNLRIRAGYTNMVVRTSDMILADAQGIFIGPQGGCLDLNVVNGKIKMYKTNTTHVSDQTRCLQVFNMSTARTSTIQCNGIETIVDTDHGLTTFLDLLWMSSTNSTLILDLRGGDIADVNVPNDADWIKKYGQDGVIAMGDGGGFLGGGNIILKGGIKSNYTQGIQINGSDISDIRIDGPVTTTTKSALQNAGSNASSRILFKDIVTSAGVFPTIIHSGVNRVFAQNGVVNSNASTGSVALLYNGAGLVLKSGSGITSNGSSITTEVASRTYKLNSNVPINKDISASPISKVIRVTVNKIVNSQTYSTTVNGTPYTFASSVSATAINIAAGLVAAIGTPSGVSSVVDNGNGTFDITATAGTNLTVTDSTSWTTQYKWEINRSAVDDIWRVTLNGTAFTFTSTDTTFYHETGGGVPNIRDGVKALIQADGAINPLIATYQVDKFGLTLICAANSVFTSASSSGNSYGYTPEPQKPLLTSIISAGYLGGMINAIGGTSFVFDADVEF